MQLNLGNKIRELRRRDYRTQENLAEALGVTAQAVSRWESGGSYPDMAMIPAIANYFHISIDELFGYHDEREEKINTILESASKILDKQGFVLTNGCLSDDVLECVNMLREAAEEFPNEPKILLKLAQALSMWGFNVFDPKVHIDDLSGAIDFSTDHNSKNIYWQEAIRVYEKLLKSNPSIEDRENAIKLLTPLYCQMGEYEKAKALANNQNTLFISRELMLPLATFGQEKARYQDERLMALLSYLCSALFESITERPSISSSEYSNELILSLIKFYETVFSDKRCGKWHFDIGLMYFELSIFKAQEGNTEKTLEFFDKGFEHCKEYERISNEDEYKYSAPLVCNLPSIQKGSLSPIGDDFFKNQLIFYPQNIKDEIRKNPKYAECFK